MAMTIDADPHRLVPVQYVGRKERKKDTVCGTKTVWRGHGDIQYVPARVSALLSLHPDVWKDVEEEARLKRSMAGDVVPLRPANPGSILPNLMDLEEGQDLKEVLAAWAQMHHGVELSRKEALPSLISKCKALANGQSPFLDPAQE